MQMQMKWLKIDVGLPRVLRTAFPTHTGASQVQYCNQTRTRGSRIIALQYLTGQFVMAVPQYPRCSSSSPRVMRKYHGTICKIFQEMRR